MIPVQSIRVGPYNIEIKLLKDEERDTNLGTYSDLRQAILMRETYASDAQEAATLLHEVIHAVYQTMSVKPKDGEERTVDLLSVGLSMFIRDNPELIKYFQGIWK